MNIRTACPADLDAIADLESACYPPAEGANRQSIAARLSAFPNHFWLLWDGDALVGFINGLVTDLPDLTDEMYDDATLHDEAGAWQMIFSVVTAQNHRRHGYAGQIMARVIADAHSHGRKGLVLTCKQGLLPFYAQFGFENEGISASTHGDAVWYQMRLTL